MVAGHSIGPNLVRLMIRFLSAHCSNLSPKTEVLGVGRRVNGTQGVNEL